MHQPLYTCIDPLVLYDEAGRDLAFFVSLSRTFLDIAPPMFDRLERAILADARVTVIHESHSLRGSAALVGARQLSNLLQEMEQLARQNSETSFISHLPELTRLFTLVLREVQLSITHFRGTPTA